MIEGKLRKRERFQASPPDGMSQTWTEWQIIVGRKIYARHGTEREARRAAASANIQLNT